MENNRSSQPVGYLLSKFGLVALLSGLLLAAWYRQIVVVILLGLALSTAGFAKLWSRFALSRVNCQRLCPENRIFLGEQIELKLRLTNRKLLPLPWIQVDDEVPTGLVPDRALAPSNRPGFCVLSRGAALLWYSGVNWRYYLKGNKRGYYSLGPITLTSGDIFGFYPRSVTLPSIDNVIVYPRIYPVNRSSFPSKFPIGESTAEQKIFEDPVRVIGLRDYRPHDSRRRIHWKASARHQQLQVKVFEPTTTLKLYLFLSVDSFQPGHGEVLDEDAFELGISIAASIAHHLITEQRSSVGLLVNTLMADSGQPARIPPSSGSGQLVQILEALAKVTPKTFPPFEEFLQNERIRLPWGATLVFIIGRLLPLLEASLARLREQGYRLVVIQVQDGEMKDNRQESDWYYVSKPSDLTKIGYREA